jgi:predicted nucleic acid-binding protein
LPFDRNSAKRAVSLYEKLESTGKMINENDLLIAGIFTRKQRNFCWQEIKKFANVDDERIKII